ncbi:MAG: DUF883 family protein [Pyrinomonadaceae bacterium]
MSQNFGNNDPMNTGGTGATGGAGTGATDAGTTRDKATGGGLTTTTGANSSTGGGTAAAAGGSGTATGAATAIEGLTGTAQEYGQKIADAATTAKDYMSDKVSVVGDKFKDLQNKDFSQVAEEAKNYAREKPGQALLISAAAGFLIGLLLKGSNRR